VDFPYRGGILPPADWPPIDLTQSRGDGRAIQNPPIDRFSPAVRKKLTPDLRAKA
jgi:hypothetical protein